MDQVVFDTLLRLLKASAPEIGMGPSDVVVDGESIVLENAGVEVHWQYDAMGTGRPGWQVREVYHCIDLLTDEEGMRTRVVGCADPDECFAVAQATMLTVVQKRLEFPLSDASAN